MWLSFEKINQVFLLKTPPFCQRRNRISNIEQGITNVEGYRKYLILKIPAIANKRETKKVLASICVHSRLTNGHEPSCSYSYFIIRNSLFDIRYSLHLQTVLQCPYFLTLFSRLVPVMDFPVQSSFPAQVSLPAPVVLLPGERRQQRCCRYPFSAGSR
ncbi:MAG: hypothetical protein HW390_567 [Candidatus Brocadiaceae bacterium]|nr:hypothetical protein [Candidatus Brocadiaceae bacterium]